MVTCSTLSQQLALAQAREHNFFCQYSEFGRVSQLGGDGPAALCRADLDGDLRANSSILLHLSPAVPDGKGHHGNIIPPWLLLQIPSYQRRASREITPRMHPDDQLEVLKQ